MSVRNSSALPVADYSAYNTEGASLSLDNALHICFAWLTFLPLEISQVRPMLVWTFDYKCSGFPGSDDDINDRKRKLNRLMQTNLS